MAIDYDQPKPGTLALTDLTNIRDGIRNAGGGEEGDSVSSPQTGLKRWHLVGKYWQRYNGASWSNLITNTIHTDGSNLLVSGGNLNMSGDTFATTDTNLKLSNSSGQVASFGGLSSASFTAGIDAPFITANNEAGGFSLNGVTSLTRTSGDLEHGKSASITNQSFYTNNILRASINSIGRFGVNTTQPRNVFHVESPISEAISLSRNTISGVEAAVGGLIFRANNSSGTGEGTAYSGVYGRILDSTAGVEGGGISFHTSTAGNFTEKARLDNNGRFGLGISDPTSLLHLKSPSSGDIYQIKLEDSLGNIGGEIGQFGTILEINGNQGINFETGGTDRVRIDASGNVGINEDSPTHLLTLDAPTNDGLSIKSGVNTRIYLEHTTGGDGQITLYNSLTQVGAVLRSNGDSYFNAGGVAIGRTSASSTLDVQGPDNNNVMSLRRSDGTITHKSIVDASGDGGWELASGLGTIGVKLRSVGFSYFNGGNVGFGTSSPSTKLEVRKDNSDTTLTSGGVSEDTMSLLNETDLTGNYTSLAFVGNSGEVTSRIASVASASNGRGSLSFLTGDSVTGFPVQRMVISDGGNVGIGTTSPSEMLSVVGNIHATGGLVTSQVSANSSYAFNMKNASGVNRGGLYIDSGGSELLLYDNSGVNQVRLRHNGESFFKGGSVLVGVNTPTIGTSDNLFQVDGDINITGSFFQNGVLTPIGGHWASNGSDISFSSGVVGVGGINGTGELLHIRRSTADNSQLTFTNASTGHSSVDGGMIGLNHANHLFLSNRDSTGKLFIQTNSTTQASVEADGTFNIGVLNTKQNHLQINSDVGGNYLQIQADGNVSNSTGIYSIGEVNSVADRFKASIELNHVYGSSVTAVYGGTQDDGVAISTLKDGTHKTTYGFTQSLLYPVFDNEVQCGDGSHRFTEFYAVNGTINTSDVRQKKEITPSKLGLDFINDLNPVSYVWLEKGVRPHYGLISQEVEEAVTKSGVEDFAGLIKTPIKDEAGLVVDETYGLRYTEFISPLIKAVQDLSKQVEELKTELNELKGN
jgi:hypothetical protein